MGAILVLQLLTASSSLDVQRRVWLVQRPGWQRQEAALLEALRIYTSDLKAAITLKPDDAKGNTHEAQLRAAQDQCSSKVSLVVWFAGGANEPALQILHCATLFTDELPCPRHSSIESLAQTMALKIRALLAQEPELSVGDETSESDAEEDDGLATLAAAADGGATTAGGSGEEQAELQGRDGLPPRQASDRDVVPPAGLGIDIGLAYLVGSTADWAGVHQGAALRIGVSLPRHSLAIEVDGSLTTPVVRDDMGQRTSLDEFPVGLTLSRHWRRGRWMASCGPRVSLHFVHAEATSSQGLWGKSWRASVGVGASELVRYDGWGQIGLFVSLTNEILLPRRTFTVAGQETAVSGFFQGAVSAGAVYRFY